MTTLYYSNGGPGPATRLVRIDVPDSPGRDDTEQRMAWYHAPGFRWAVSDGWQPYDIAQGEVTQTGEFGMIDSSEVDRVMQEMRDRAAQFEGP